MIMKIKQPNIDRENPLVVNPAHIVAFAVHDAGQLPDIPKSEGKILAFYTTNTKLTLTIAPISAATLHGEPSSDLERALLEALQTSVH